MVTSQGKRPRNGGNWLFVKMIPKGIDRRGGDMVNKLVFIILVFGCLLPGCSSRQTPEPSRTLSIPGSGACEQVLRALAEAFNAQHPGVNVEVPRSTGTRGGIKAVIEGTHRLGRIGRPLKADELANGLMFLPFAHDAVVFAVGSHVGIDNLGSAQLADIFSGAITAWQELNGPQEPIRVLIRQADETSLTIIRRNLPAFREVIFSDQAKIAFHDYEMMELLNKFPSAIGFLTHSSVVAPGNQMQAIGIDGVFPTRDNLDSGLYPLKATYGLVYGKEKLNALASQFLDFIFSANGGQIIEDFGLVPMVRNR